MNLTLTMADHDGDVICEEVVSLGGIRALALEIIDQDEGHLARLALVGSNGGRKRLEWDVSQTEARAWMKTRRQTIIDAVGDHMNDHEGSEPEPHEVVPPFVVAHAPEVVSLVENLAREWREEAADYDPYEYCHPDAVPGI